MDLLMKGLPCTAEVVHGEEYATTTSTVTQQGLYVFNQDTLEHLVSHNKNYLLSLLCLQE